ILTREGFATEEAGSAEEASERLARTPFDLLVTDLMLPGRNGVELIQEALAKYPEIVGIVMTGRGPIEAAVDAMRKGACDYLTKPFKLIELVTRVHNALRQRDLRFENQYLRSQLTDRYAFDNIIGSGPAMRQIFDLIQTVAPLNTTVLIQGET